MDSRSRFLMWVGALAGFLGFAVFNFAEPGGDLLPLNRALLAAVCTLAVIWLFVSVIQAWGIDRDRPSEARSAALPTGYSDRRPHV
jgi:hypothetical protein